MNTLQFLTEQLEKLRRSGENTRLSPLRNVDTSAKSSSATTNTSPNILQKLHCSSSLRKIHPPLMWSLAVVSLTSVIGYRFYHQPKLAVGTVSPVTIIAPRDGIFEDIKTTEEKRKEVRTGIIPVLQRDLELTSQLRLTLTETLAEIEGLRRMAGYFPIIAVQKIPSRTQQYLRVASEKEWQVFRQYQGKVSSNIPNLNPNLNKAWADFQRYEQTVTKTEVNGLLAKFSESRQRYNQAKTKIANIRSPYLTPNVMTAFLDLNQSSWEMTYKAIQNTANKILMQGLPVGMPDNLLEEIIQLHLHSSLPASNEVIATKLLLSVLQGQHNLSIDKEETKQRAEQAAQAVEPVIVEIKRHDVIVKAGQVITQKEFVLLDSFGLSRREINWLGLGVTVILVGGGVSIFCLINRRIHRPMRRRDHLLLCLLSLSTPILAIFNLGYTNLPAIGLLTSSFYGPTLAVTQVLLLSGLSTFTSGTVNWSYILAGTAGGLLSACLAGKLRSRDELARLGGGVGIIQGAFYFAVYLSLTPVAGTIWSAVLPGAIVYGLSGFLWSVMALGISPYLERLFDLVTPIRLVELANPNCPLLKRLSTETPGTFQHTLFVACLAEAAARELHCNVELIRAGTLYHDIGKMHDPLGFIENQMGAPNKHDQINDPWKSVEIIKKHVTEGLVMARKYGLPRVIRDFIPEHQGTLLISYFYYQAKQQAEKEGTAPISEEDFRYAGPIPQSRETGIVMLADGCEAALRSLKEATPEAALGMINKIFKARWRDNQLTDCGIKYEELPIIADVFVKVWQQFHHQRIVYPKAALDTQATTK
ncbi:7TM receptor with intracellular metal dependent phosphohydrolase [Rippkaea orientalis PCC 8801]|uniref:7TM receptor with intracellular metal dependent phosphohydrolase n=1 Tax=Rippkaea orientalis (strain PCC 8801 / RF-1) TaxID=41431 RepID=B7K0M5_RIPO1|nr:HD family phosphohydrolase [Rippkaea orientalis]ACK64179.1 7TM receptor with intracellular metal dependent phosphohydrolase [Rippkaea orientalis PCC 8801]